MEQRNIFSVRQINEYLRMKMDGDTVLSSVLVRGEISNCKLYSSGHLYFTLKDEEGQLKGVMFRSYASRLLFAPADGMRVIVHGRISVYGASGQYQLYADEMQADGAGSLALRFEQLKQKLAGEGLFEASRKRPLPPMPRRIGVITSPTGAAIHDMIHVMGRRYPLCQLILYPSLVQGAGAPLELISGLEFFGATGIVDLIIIGRGGGSAEDLWAFNDEQLARAVAACPIPVISAVGHESDFTICDFVADRRAPTPSAAAEIAVPNRYDLLSGLSGAEERLKKAMLHRIGAGKTKLEALSSSVVFRVPERLLDVPRQRTDRAADLLHRAMARDLEQKKQALSIAARRIQILDPLGTLLRGYAAVTDEAGQTVTKASQLQAGDTVSIRFSDGTRRATVLAEKGQKYDKEKHEL